MLADLFTTHPLISSISLVWIHSGPCANLCVAEQELGERPLRQVPLVVHQVDLLGPLPQAGDHDLRHGERRVAVVLELVPIQELLLVDVVVGIAVL
jgi:hypothetical protein